MESQIKSAIQHYIKEAKLINDLKQRARDINKVDDYWYNRGKLFATLSFIDDLEEMLEIFNGEDLSDRPLRE